MTLDYDVVVVGGGIQGAGIAQVFAVNNVKVLLLEQSTIASQTSSRSSKLIHGGLRYLETGQFQLVRECLKEREILLRIAPHLVHWLPFHIPIYKNSRHGPAKLKIGLSFYALLAGLRKHSGFSQVKIDKWDSLDGITTSNLRQVLRYFDAQTNDKELTQAVINSAVRYGAQVIENATFVDAETLSVGMVVRYCHQDAESEIKTRLVVNAAGPWINEVTQRIRVKKSPEQQAQDNSIPIELVQGAHVEVKGTLSQGVYYLEAPSDKRAVFVMPWQSHILVGTTETPYDYPPADAKPTQSEINYLRETLASYFPRLASAELLNSFAGLRVLPRSGSNLSTRKRDTVILMDDRRNPTLISVCGGKLTAYRATAEKVFFLARDNLHLRTRYVDTRFICL